MLDTKEKYLAWHREYWQKSAAQWWELALEREAEAHKHGMERVDICLYHASVSERIANEPAEQTLLYAEFDWHATGYAKCGACGQHAEDGGSHCDMCKRDRVALYR